eukprot:m.31484 g.31484  ORF g.31484 m.31484 type:complete len:436 (+) comp8323_c0_seq2:123-1430(+)
MSFNKTVNSNMNASKDLKTPTCWNDHDKSPLLEIIDGLKVRYKAKPESSSSSTVAAAVRSNFPISSRMGLFYYEVSILNRGQDGYIGIGLCAAGTATNKLPGWEDKFSYGYHGDDGNAFCCSGTGQKYGPQFTTGDVIGCCVNFLDQTCFFTKNGKKLGVAFRNMGRKEGKPPEPLFACVGLNTQNEEVEANFGSKPFVFDIEGQRRELEYEARKLIDEYQFPNEQCSPQGISKVIISYLIHHGYHETVEILARDRNIQLPVSLESIRIRREIYDLVLKGEIENAIISVDKEIPGFLDSHPRLKYRLYCRKFIESIRPNTTNDELKGMLTLGSSIQTLFDALKNPTDDDKALLRDTFSLLAYTDPTSSDCPVAHLLSNSARQPLAMELNSAILEASGQPAQPPLEVLVGHASTCLKTMLDYDMGEAAFLKISEFN